MKKFIIILGIISLFLFSNTAEAKRLQAYMSYSTFYSPADGPYIETYMIVLGNSIKYKLNEHNKYQGTIEVTLIFRQDSVIKNFKKINLLSPEVEDTSIINFNFIDQQRFLLPAGTYDVEITIADINDNAIPYKANETIEIEFNPDKISISGIELVESFKKSEAENILTKNGYDIMPYIIYYYPEKIEKLTYYAEVYNTDKILGDNEKLLLSTYIEVNENNQLYGDFIKVKRETAKNVIVVMSEFDISQLPTGNFNLVIEVRDKDNQQKAIRKLYFERDNTKVAFEIKNVEKVVTEHTFVQMYTNKDTLA
ncbi:MAG: hypothetical protein PHR81_11470, partial [Bacteroidales bacterium]|nr:hypothetical protein [Bacteroidales bacterium]